ncbi:MAG TPA: hypothetical protein PKV56_06470 [Burkholderiaceae bacterium]|nr:hypothetical protein [Burkholderiaceae bacterium]
MDELLAKFASGTVLAIAPAARAKAANSAKSEHPRGQDPALRVCEGLRTSANAVGIGRRDDADSQNFADIRKPERGPHIEESCGSSQDSQDSQGHPVQCIADIARDSTAIGWTDAEVARFLDRRARLMRWGWPELEAEALADRLLRRDQDHDDRVSCADCKHYRPGRCGNHRRAGLNVADIGRDLATLLQRCPGFDPIG